MIEAILGGDWAFGCQLVDGVLGSLGTPAAQMPMRIFTPQVWLVGELLADPKHLFRSFTVKELGRLMSARPDDLDARPRAHEMGIYKRYFDLIASGHKTTEIRVNDSSRKKIKAGSLIRFRCREEEVLTRVTRVARYADFEEMFAHEDLGSVNPLATKEEQLANVRQIYPPEREALGVLALGIELV